MNKIVTFCCIALMMFCGVFGEQNMYKEEKVGDVSTKYVMWKDTKGTLWKISRIEKISDKSVQYYIQVGQSSSSFYTANIGCGFLFNYGGRSKDDIKQYVLIRVDVILSHPIRSDSIYVKINNDDFVEKRCIDMSYINPLSEYSLNEASFHCGELFSEKFSCLKSMQLRYSEVGGEIVTDTLLFTSDFSKIMSEFDRISNKKEELIF